MIRNSTLPVLLILSLTTACGVESTGSGVDTNETISIDLSSEDSSAPEDIIVPSDTTPGQDSSEADTLDVPPIELCTSHADCDDGIDCTTDLCTIEGICSNEVPPAICLVDGACFTEGDINPNNECQECKTAISGTTWSPRHLEPCDDGDECTEESFCNKEACEGVDLPACCGNGIVEEGERCDGDCPDACDDADNCTFDSLSGSAADCDALCVFEPHVACGASDGCCAPFCTAETDSDCAGGCGDGIVGPDEICDGDCPTSCDDGNTCTADTLSGDPATCDATCAHELNNVCTNDDGCCPSNCDINSDSDCAALCGNGVIDEGELCDGICPTKCVGSHPCMNFELVGSPSSCDAQCVNIPIPGCVPEGDCVVDIRVECIENPPNHAVYQISVNAQHGYMEWNQPPMVWDECDPHNHSETPCPSPCPAGGNWFCTVPEQSCTTHKNLINFCLNDSQNKTPVSAQTGSITAKYWTGLCGPIGGPVQVCEATLDYVCP